MDMGSIHVRILFQDEHIIVCVKPAGILSQPSEKNKHSMISVLADQTGKTVYPVHRLDLNTEGLMVFALNKQAAASLGKQMAESDIHKQYLAVVQGPLAHKAAVLEDYLYFDRRQNKSYVVRNGRKGSKYAKLAYYFLEEKNGKVLVQISLFTGRTHQIRVQFASRKNPLAGDRRYGGCPGQFSLVAASLNFRHPYTDEKMNYRYIPSGLDCFENIEMTELAAEKNI